jgi:hypothetical protein
MRAAARRAPGRAQGLGGWVWNFGFRALGSLPRPSAAVAMHAHVHSHAHAHAHAHAHVQFERHKKLEHHKNENDARARAHSYTRREGDIQALVEDMRSVGALEEGVPALNPKP